MMRLYTFLWVWIKLLVLWLLIRCHAVTLYLAAPMMSANFIGGYTCHPQPILIVLFCTVFAQVLPQLPKV